jgi:hypothetical protein
LIKSNEGVPGTESSTPQIHRVLGIAKPLPQPANCDPFQISPIRADIAD